MQIIPLSEGSFSVDQSKKFIPLLPDDDPAERTSGSLMVQITPFLVKTGNELILLDTGLGFEEDGELQLIQNIRRAGYDASQVTKVLISHLHKDHAGGIKSLSKNELSLPNAKYYVQRAELELATAPGSSSYDADQFDLLKGHEQLVLLDGDGNIDDLIRYEISAGHSRYHQVFWLNADGDTAFFGGDEAPQLGQMKRRLAAKYDYDGRRAMELRSKWWEEGQEKKWHFMFYHGRKNPVFKAE